MKTIIKSLIYLLLSFTGTSAFALNDNGWNLGLSYISQNFLNEVTQKTDGSASLMGTANYALDGGYKSDLARDWFWTGRLLYTPLPRSADGNTASITLTQIKLLVGQDLGGARASGALDWFAGLGILKEDFKGKGGLTQMNNGTGTATFAVPGNSSSSLNGTQSVGLGYTSGSTRFAGEIAFQNFFNEKKRTQSLILSFLYIFPASRGGRR